MDKNGRTNRLLSRLAVGLMLAAMALFTGCPNKITVKPETFAVTFSAGEHGTLKAKADGVTETDKSPISVEKDKTVTFTATPVSGYVVDKWTVNGTAITNDTTTYSHKVTAKIEVKVSFKAKPPAAVAVIDVMLDKTELTLEEEKTEQLTATVTPTNATNKKVTWSSDKPDIASVDATGKVTAHKVGEAVITVKTEDGGKTASCTVNVTAKPPKTYKVTFSVDGTGGTLKAKAEGIAETETSPITIEQGKTVTFTATPDSGYRVKEWKVGNDVVTGNTSNTYTCTVTQAVTVKVSFLAGEASYKVKHYKEKAEGGYPTEPTETESLSGTVGTNAAYTPKTGGAYEGFTYKSELTKINGSLQTSGMIKPDGSTVVELYYERNTVSITFGVEGTNGTLKAEVDGNEIHSGDKVKHGKTVTFTATPSSGYKVKEWKADGTVVTGNTSNTYTCTVTKAVHITVSFAPLDVGSFEDTGGGFIKITPPANGIAGVAPGCTLPGNDAYWKGVFIKDRKVKLSPYKLGKTEVTYKLWKEVHDWAVKPEHGYVFANAGQKGSDGTGNDEDQPVTRVSWRDCIVWCNAYTEKEKGIEYCVYRKSKTDIAVLKNATDTAACDAAYADMSKKGFRLPTEAEWEYAARWQGSDKTNAAQYGDVWLTKLNSASGAKGKWDTAETGAVARYDGNSGGKTHPVGKKRANALGLHDMSGNVWEWCFDWYKNDPASNDAAYMQGGIVTDPQGGASGTNRVKRGGSWGDGANLCAVGFRNDDSADGRNFNLGFRLACRP